MVYQTKELLISLLLIAGAASGEDSKLDVQLTGDQQAAFEKFHEMVKGEVKDSPFLSQKLVLAKFFKAAMFDAGMAKINVQSTASFRTQWKLDSIEGDPETTVLIDLIGGHPGEHDKEGYPLFYLLAAKWGMRTAFNSMQIDRWRRAFYILHEKAAQEAIKGFEGGKTKAAKYGAYADYRAWTVHEGACVPCLPVIGDLAKGMEAHWPNFKTKCTAVNTEKGVDQILNIIKPLLSPDLQATLQVYGGKSEWWDKVAQDVDTAVMEKLFDEKTAIADPGPSLFGGRRK